MKRRTFSKTMGALPLLGKFFWQVLGGKEEVVESTMTCDCEDQLCIECYPPVHPSYLAGHRQYYEYHAPQEYTVLYDSVSIENKSVVKTKSHHPMPIRKKLINHQRK